MGETRRNPDGIISGYCSMPRRNELIITEIATLCAVPPLSLKFRTQELAYHLRFVLKYNACDILEAKVCSRGQMNSVTKKYYKHRKLDQWGRTALLFPIEDTLLHEWVVRELTEARFHFLYQIRNKVCKPTYFFLFLSIPYW
jgi:hypothetical protein